MSKLFIAIVNSMTDGEWLTSAQIAKRVGYKAPSVRSMIVRLIADGALLRKEDPTNPGGVVYRKARAPVGFGISRNMADFQSLVRRVRP